MRFAVLALAAGLMAGTPAVAAPVQDRAILTLEGAKTILAAAEADAARRKLKVTITIVDFAGLPLAMARMDDASTVGVEISLAKARTAAGFNTATGVYEQRLQQENMLRLLTLPIVASEGGIPIKVNGRTIGAIGVSGATSQEDGLIATAGIAAIEPALAAR